MSLESALAIFMPSEASTLRQTFGFAIGWNDEDRFTPSTTRLCEYNDWLCGKHVGGFHMPPFFPARMSLGGQTGISFRRLLRSRPYEG